MTLSVKQRPIPFTVPAAHFTMYQHWYDLKTHANAGALTVNGTQITESEGHPRPRNRSRLADGDIGGEFFTQKKTISGGGNSAIGFSSGPWDPSDFSGSVQWMPIAPSNGAFPTSAHSSKEELRDMGAIAISRCKPTKSTASLAVALGELHKDGLPNIIGSSLWENKARDIRRQAASGGDEYLNAVFGWKPLLNDVRQLAHGVKNADKLARQYIRDAGKPVRRSYSFPQIRSITEDVFVGNDQEWVAPFNSYFWNGAASAKAYYSEETVIDRWFSGAFKYALPLGMSEVLGKRVSAASNILGAELTPETLWNLAPWSWAVDWFSNTGDVVSNLSDWATDGLVMHYGYMMEHSIVTRTYYSQGSRMLFAAGSSAPDLVFKTETKQRVRAHPFGFNATWSGLSPVQTAIAAALGISRS
jgi:hypothetical protein